MYHVCLYHNVATKLQLTYKFSLTSQVSAFFGFQATLTINEEDDNKKPPGQKSFSVENVKHNFNFKS